MSNILNTKIYPVILCGGVGKRLWPLSRKTFPKPFITFNNQNSLLQDTVLRIPKLANCLAPIIVCNQSHKELVTKQMDAISIRPSSLILEPAPRNTSIAIAISALEAIYMDKTDCTMLLVMPSDHAIENTNNFSQAISLGVTEASNGYVVTYGVTPTHPSSEYGYIESGSQISKGSMQITAFKEKPDTLNAAKMIATGGHYWNSGIFTFTAQTILRELQTYAPDIYQIATASHNKARRIAGLTFPDTKTFLQAPPISIDYAVMEHIQKSLVIPFFCNWNDIGSWSRLLDTVPTDSHGNSIDGHTLLDSTQNCFIHSPNCSCITIGLNATIIISNNDFLFLADINMTAYFSKLEEKLENLVQPTGSPVKTALNKNGNTDYLPDYQLQDYQNFCSLISNNPTGNITTEQTLLDSCQDCATHGAQRIIYILGLKNILIIENKEFILIADRRRVAEVIPVLQRFYKDKSSLKRPCR